MASLGVDDCCDGSSINNECEEDIVARHKNEKKELQAHILKLKHTITKGDKKKKKDVTEQIAKLEAELEARHRDELQNLKSKLKVSPSILVESALLSKTDEDVDDDAEGESSVQSTGKKSKAQKRRHKKDAASMQQQED